MSIPFIYNLEEFAQQNGICDVYGASVGCFSSDTNILKRLKQPGRQPSFYSIVLMIDGWHEYSVGNHLLKVEMNDLFITLPYYSYLFSNCSAEVNAIHLLVEKNFFDELIMQNEQLKDNKKQRHYLANKGLSSQGYGFSNGHVWMWELDCEES